MDLLFQPNQYILIKSTFLSAQWELLHEAMGVVEMTYGQHEAKPSAVSRHEITLRVL